MILLLDLHRIRSIVFVKLPSSYTTLACSELFNLSHAGWWQDDRHSLSAIVEGFFWMLSTRQTCTFVSTTFIAMLMTPIADLFNITDMINSVAENPCGRSMRQWCGENHYNGITIMFPDIPCIIRSPQNAWTSPEVNVLECFFWHF